MFRVLLAESLDADAAQRLEAACEVVRPQSIDEAALCESITDCDAVISRTHARITRAVLAAGKRLRVVGVAGVGVDHVDTTAARELGIAVLNTPAASSDAVAEITITLIMQLLRPVAQLAGEYRAGRFHAARKSAHGPELCELTVGVLGMGRIGSRVGRICSAGFGARVLYNDIVDVGPFGFPAEPVDRPTLWSESDILTLHVPLTEQTQGLIDADVLAQARPSLRLVNTARGAVVDTDALTQALETGRIAGAALDVTHPEPLPPNHPLLSFPTCTVTPHVASRTFGGLARMYAIVDDVLEFLRASE